MTVNRRLPIDQPNVFVLGCQKCATTWLYRALGEHPELCTATGDELHYFDINYHEGRDWYARWFSSYAGERYVLDTTSSYVRDPRVPGRIREHNAEAKLIVCLRNPIDRAFSHYWHEKRKGRIGSGFEDLFHNYDLFQSWIATGFYADHLQRWLAHFDRKQLLVVLHDDLEREPAEFIASIHRFIGVDDACMPSVLGRKFNTGVPPAPGPQHHGWLGRVWHRLRGETPAVQPATHEPTEYERGMSPAVRAALVAIYQPEVRALQHMLSRDLSHWLTGTAATAADEHPMKAAA